MDILDDDLLRVWKTLEANAVKYIMIGGIASIFHGTSRITQDADVWIEDSLENRKALRSALQDAGIGDFEQLETLEFVPGFTTIYLNEFIELDFFTDLKFYTKKDFAECYTLAETAVIENISIKFLHIDHLLFEKQTANRPKDQFDIEELQKIKKIIDNNENRSNQT
jgi:hypothetical protein